jgi:hypothetical protein
MDSNRNMNMNMFYKHGHGNLHEYGHGHGQGHRHEREKMSLIIGKIRQRLPKILFVSYIEDNMLPSSQIFNILR